MLDERGKEYWVESDIVWPTGLECVGRKQGSLAHGQTWILHENTADHLEALTKQKEKIEAGIRYVCQKMGDLEKMLEEYSDEDYDQRDYRHVEKGKRQLSDDESYLDSDDDRNSSHDDERKDNAKKGSRYTNERYVNPHDRSDIQSELERKSRTKLQLEDALDDIQNQIDTLKTTTFQSHGQFRTIPKLLNRIDAPWLQFSSDKDTAGSQAQSARPGHHKGNRKSTDVQSSQPCDVPTTAHDDGNPSSPHQGTPPNNFCAKLLSPSSQEFTHGRRFLYTQTSAEAKRSLEPLLREGEDLLNHQWRILLRHNEDFEQICLLPLVAVLPVTHKNHAAFCEAAFLSPLCPNGSVADVISKMSGKRSSYWFKESLILNNLKATIRTMALLEREGVAHGCIHPWNIYISSDGEKLLVGDFLPKTELTRWFADLRKGLTNTPPYFSPEMYSKLVVNKLSISTLDMVSDIVKHDVFCLGLTYYFIVRRTIAKDIFQSRDALKDALKKLRAEKHDPELVQCLTSMLTYDPAYRPSFWDLLSFSEKSVITGESILDAAKQFIGWVL